MLYQTLQGDQFFRCNFIFLPPTFTLPQKMSQALAAALLFSVLNYEISMSTASGDDDFFHNCPSFRCSNGTTEIRFPFRLASSPPSCGAPGMELSCSKEADTILLHPNLGPCKVTAIDYRYSLLNVIPLEESWTQCPLQKITTTNLSTSVYRYDASYPGTLVCCSREFIPSKEDSIRTWKDGNMWDDSIVGPISCLSKTSQFMYLMDSGESMSLLPSGCTVVSNDISMPTLLHHDARDYVLFSERAKRIITFAEITLTWSIPKITNICQDCEQKGHLCGFSSQHRQAFCKSHGSRVKVIAATSSVATLVVLFLMAASALYLSLKSKTDEEVRLKIEIFLKTYSTSKPTRYTFSEVKKITRRFKDKLGQGGFGSVYKGQLANGVPVAVKMLDNPKGNGEEFINEVATIGRIHHANVVRLLGFCSEGTRRVLIYQFMPNESLEKYIFSHESYIRRELLTPNKMMEIASGIARGVEYLHQGCNQRIVHFNIKPHNILLDYSFNPKISDFGLAKLCARDQSIVTLTTARGTMGYIAPELYSRNFGTISYKSDVYSFGMLVLEMVSGRRNSDPWIENQNEIYIPEWMYEKIIIGEGLQSIGEMTQEEKEIERKLVIVALWCIQWNPKNRPSMPKVVNMLTGSLPNLTMPPKPFLSSRGIPYATNLETF